MTAATNFTRFITTLVTMIWLVLPRWGRWVASILLVLWLGWTFLIQEHHGGAALIVMSVMERPIVYARVNGSMGGNTDAFDGRNAGGKTAGPYRISGNTVKIDWLLSTTLKQKQEQGLRPEKHSIILPMPERKKGQDDFCVLFLPDNKPMIRWTSSCHIDMQDVIDIYRTRKL